MNRQSKRNLIIALWVFILPYAASAQVYEPAFIYTVFGDTIRCQLKHIRFITNKAEFRYKKSLDDNKDLFINSRDVLWIITPTDTFECLKSEKGIDKGQVYAYRLLVNGRLRLYSQDRFTKMGGETAYLFFIKKEGMPLREITTFDYQKYLSQYMRDDEECLLKIKEITAFDEKRIKQLIKEYNAKHE